MCITLRMLRVSLLHVVSLRTVYVLCCVSPSRSMRFRLRSTSPSRRISAPKSSASARSEAQNDFFFFLSQNVIFSVHFITVVYEIIIYQYFLFTTRTSCLWTIIQRKMPSTRDPKCRTNMALFGTILSVWPNIALPYTNRVCRKAELMFG